MRPIFQGTYSDITAVLYDDSGAVINDFTDKKLSIALIERGCKLIHSWSTATDGADEQIAVGDDGVIAFRIGEDLTRTMLGDYHLEAKVTQNGARVGESVIPFTVKGSVIGKEVSL